MAYTRIHAIRSTVQKSVDYICNPQKTDGELLVSSFACSPKTAGFEFDEMLSNTRSSDTIKAHHLIQSFAPGEVSAEEAHRIGIELADRLLKGNYSYVVATHNDKNHPHSHIIFCAAGNRENRKFNSCKRSYFEIRKLSDELCREHDLSIIIPGKSRGKSYAEWKADKEGRSWKTQMRLDIDSVIKAAASYEDFIRLIREKGYEVKGDGLGKDALKYISFKAPGQQRFVRGSERSLGAKYTRDAIMERILNKDKVALPEQRTARKRSQDIVRKSTQRKTLIDTSGEKFQNSPYLKRWADKQNLQVAASSYAEAGNLKEFREKIEKKKSEVIAVRSELSTIRNDLKELKEIRYYLTKYKENVSYRRRYDEAEDKERFLQAYEEKLALFDMAKDKLQGFGITPNIRELNQVNADISGMEKRVSELEMKLETVSKEKRDLEQKYRNITEYLGIENKENAYETEHEKSEKIRKDRSDHAL